MHRVIRVFLVWVMVFAIPLQGMAASTMAFCGPSHQRMVQGLMQDALATDPSQADGHANHAAAAAHGHEAHGDAQATAAQPESGKDSSPNHSQFSCSACAACCSVLALPSSFWLPQAAEPAHPMQTALSTPIASRLSDGLERPPRTDLV